MIPRDLARWIYNDVNNEWHEHTEPQILGRLESLLRAHDDELIERCALTAEKFIKQTPHAEWCKEGSCICRGDQIAKAIRQLKTHKEPEYECNCEDLRTCRDLYGNKHGAIDRLKYKKKKL